MRDSETFTANAMRCREEADAATLDNVRDRCLRAEAAWVATAIRAGGGFAHGRLAFKLSGIHDEHREHVHA